MSLHRELLKTEEVAQVIGVKASTLRNWIREGTFAVAPVPRPSEDHPMYFRRSDIEAFVGAKIALDDDVPAAGVLE
jgi:predicted DNA-binding transcriptional regulator AlpA